MLNTEKLIKYFNVESKEVVLNQCAVAQADHKSMLIHNKKYVYSRPRVSGC